MRVTNGENPQIYVENEETGFEINQCFMFLKPTKILLQRKTSS